tara:strand:- start:118 stop:666 length:549 start_codon:yes stop_codon:yes gene_type:complete
MTDNDLSKSQVDKQAKTDTFDLVFRGEIAPGNSVEEVKQRVAASFNLDLAAAEQLFSGSASRLKRGVDKATAERILQRLCDAGAIAIIVPNTAQPATEEPIPQSSLSLAPLGSNVMEASEKLGDKELVDEEPGDKKPAVTKKRVLLSLDHLSLEPIGTNMVKETEVPAIKAPDLDTSKFSLE